MTFGKCCQYCNLNGTCELQILDNVELCKKYIEWKNKIKTNHKRVNTKCNKCNKEVGKCKDCDSDFNSVDDICCVKTDFFGNGENVYYRHICKKCANELINSTEATND